MAKNENKIIVADSMVKFFDSNIMMIGLFGWVPSRRSFKTKEKSKSFPGGLTSHCFQTFYELKQRALSRRQ